MQINRSERIKHLPQDTLAELAAKRRAIEEYGIQVIDLSTESPDMAPSLDIREAVSQSSLLAWNYSYSNGDMPPLREAACSWYWARFDVDLEPESEILFLDGSQDGLVHMFMAFTDPGDKVLLCDPYSPAYLTGAILAGCEPVFMPLRAENDYLPDLSAISPEDADAAKVMVVSYPNNPTTALAPDSFWNELIAFAARHNILVVNDNSYGDITYDGVTTRSFLGFDGAKEVGIELNSLSHTYSIPGMRAAFMMGNSGTIEVFSRLKNNLTPGSFYPVQYAVITALTQEQSCVLDVRSMYEERRNVMTAALNSVGLSPVPCKGTPYLWIPLPKGAPDDRVFCSELLTRSHVLLTPGSCFGSEGKGHVRASLMRKSSVLEEAVKAIAASGLY